MVAAQPVATSLAAETPVSATTSVAVERLRVGEEADVAITVSIAEGWHINSNEPGLDFLIPTSVSFELPKGLSVVGDVKYPAPLVRQLRLGGSRDLELYEGEVRFDARIRYDEMAAPLTGPPVAILRYQACTDTLCLRPASVRMPLPVKLAAIEGVARAGFNEEAADTIARLVAGGLWVIVPGMLLLGLALNLTPCVYPLVSVTIAYFGSQAHSRGRKIGLALLYTLGIAITFSALGAAAAMSGGLFGGALTNPPVLVGVALIMIALALSSFGLYQIRLPSALASRVGRAGRGGAGALFMGMTMGLVAAPCVGPVVVGLLVFVGSRGDVLLGLGLFFLLALGLGVPYVALAIAAGSINRLPRSGAWLEWTEHLFGCILLAMAIYFVQPVLPDPLARFLMPAFLSLAVVYLAFIDPVGRELRGFLTARRLGGTVALVLLGLVYLPSAQTQESLVFEPFTAEAYDRVRAGGAPFVVEFGAEWCLPCKEMEERTFTDPKVIQASQGMAFLTVDMTTTDRLTELILESFEVLGAPTTLFFGPDGKERTRRVGFIGPQDFADLLEESRRPVSADRAPSGDGRQGA